MIRLLKFLFTGSWHEHEWETMHESDAGYLDDGRWKVIGSRKECRCKGCGKWKKFDLI